MFDSSVIACGHCQQPNWIPSGWEVGKLACTHCGTDLLARPSQTRGRRNLVLRGVSEAVTGVALVATLSPYGLVALSRIDPPAASLIVQAIERLSPPVMRAEAPVTPSAQQQAPSANPPWPNPPAPNPRSSNPPWPDPPNPMRPARPK